MPERRAVVLAGGLGERLKKVVSDRPKPLAEVAGKPFLEWVLRQLAKQGVTRAVISSGYKAEQMAEAVSAMRIPGLKTVCRAEATPLGTAGGIKNAVAGEEPGDWLVCNGDTLALADLNALYESYEGNDAAVLGVEMKDAARYGRLELGADGNLKAFKEKQPGSGLINAGYLILSERLITQIPHGKVSLEADLFPRWLDAGAGVGVAAVDAPFIDIGTESSYAEAAEFVLSHEASFA